MIINDFSKIQDILQAVKGTWNITKDDNWRCLEMGELKIYRKLCNAGDNVLPKTFINQRKDIYGYVAFTKDDITGGVITLQQQYITLKENALVIIFVF